MTELLGMLLLFGAIALLIALIYGIAQIYEYFSTQRYYKKYPRWAKFIEEYNQAISEQCSFYNTNISPLSRKIDTLERSKEYMPKVECERIDTEIEALKERHFELKQQYDRDYRALKNRYYTEGKQIAKEENCPYYAE